MMGLCGDSGNLKPSLTFEANLREDGCGRTVTDGSLTGRPGASPGGDSTFFLVFLSVDITSIVTWLLTEVPAGGSVGFDPFLFSIGMFFPHSCICPHQQG